MMRPLGSVLKGPFLMLAAALMLASAPAGAEATTPDAAARPAAGRSVSYSVWNIDGASVRLRFMLPAAEARDLVAPGAPPPNMAAVAAAVAAKVGVSTPAGDCSVVNQGEWVGDVYTMALIPGLDRFEIIFDCPQAEKMVLRDQVLFDRAPTHVDYAQVQVTGGRTALLMFTRDHQTLALPASPAKLPDAGMDRFAGQGFWQALYRADRLCVMAGLLLLARRWRDIGWIAGALGLGYLASLAASLGGLATSGVVDAAIGLLIVLLGVGGLKAHASGLPVSRPWRIGLAACTGLFVVLSLTAGLVRNGTAALAAAGLAVFGGAQIWIAGARPRLRWAAFAPAVVFGLLDGMGLPHELAVLQPPALQVAPLQVAYDIGAMTAAGALLAIGFAAVWLVSRRWKPTWGPDVVSAALIGLGLFWFVSRAYG